MQSYIAGLCFFSRCRVEKIQHPSILNPSKRTMASLIKHGVRTTGASTCRACFEGQTRRALGSNILKHEIRSRSTLTQLARNRSAIPSQRIRSFSSSSVRRVPKTVQEAKSQARAGVSAALPTPRSPSTKLILVISPSHGKPASSSSSPASA